MPLPNDFRKYEDTNRLVHNFLSIAYSKINPLSSYIIDHVSIFQKELIVVALGSFLLTGVVSPKEAAMHTILTAEWPHHNMFVTHMKSSDYKKSYLTPQVLIGDLKLLGQNIVNSIQQLRPPH